jgi:DNA mismatch repair protein MutS2
LICGKVCLPRFVLFAKSCPQGAICTFGCGMFLRAFYFLRSINMNHLSALEYDNILVLLAGHAMCEAVKTRCLSLAPTLIEDDAVRFMDETTQARNLIELAGMPPLPIMNELHKVLALAAADAMLIPEQISHIASFLVSCRRMKQYLIKAEATGIGIARYGGSIDELPDLCGEIDRCIVNGQVDDRASAELAGIRRRIINISEQIKSKLDELLRKNKAWFSEGFVSVKNGRFTLPVKREHKGHVSGSLIELSNSGSTCFIEPSAVSKLQSELYTLKIEEDCEVRRILYTLTALISDSLRAIKLNIEALETLDFLFAKGKLSLSMKASPVKICSGRTICIVNARHPLLDAASAVPLNFEIGTNACGVVITGPNTGGKTVALKTVGLLSLMAQSGLHVPADECSMFKMNNYVLCDIGDGQSIAENLSTFSSHMKNIIGILGRTNQDSLVLLDELGSGTDPTEGMGLAIAVLDELRALNCLYIVTTHYPEIKDYAASLPGIVNARMAFDKESLLPLYRLELGEAGESCALYIAERLGMPRRMLNRAAEAAYGAGRPSKDSAGAVQRADGISPDQPLSGTAAAGRNTADKPAIIKHTERKTVNVSRSGSFNIGDSVIVYPQKEIGIVYRQANEKGELGVQVKKKKMLINHKRIKLHVPASELYPEDYDFSIIFDSVANRKARHIMEKRHEDGNVITISEGDGHM